VLGYVLAGFLIIAGLTLLAGASAWQDFNDSTGSGGYAVEGALDGIANLIAAGLLISGAVTVTGGRARGRILFTVGAGIVLPYCVYWLIRFDNGAAAFWAVIFAAITILALVFLWRPEVGRWLSGRLAAGNPGATGRGR
jgi:hypothetical protein